MTLNMIQDQSYSLSEKNIHIYKYTKVKSKVDDTLSTNMIKTLIQEIKSSQK